MGQSQSTRRGTPSHRLPRSSGRNKTEDSEVSETSITNEERTKSENTVSNENIESNANDEKSENNMKHSIPILTVTDASPDDKEEIPSRYFQRDSNYLDIAQEASEAFGLGESPVLFARYPLPKCSQPELPQPTNLLNPPTINRTRASSIELERKPELQYNDNTNPEKASGSDFKASKGQKEQNTVPCVFKWTPKSAGALAKINSKENLMHNRGNEMAQCDDKGRMYKKRPLLRRPKEVFLSGTFNNWQLIPMSDTSSSCFVTIIELPLGTHEYKFVVDGEWTYDPTQPSIEDGIGGKNNTIAVNSTDRDAFDALDVDMKCLSKSPSDGFGQDVPHPNPPVSARGRQRQCPPVLPPHLLQVMLNKETPLVCEPTLLPTPNHVMINHMYALSFKDNVIVLSETSRYRKKYATTVFYKPV